MSPNSPVKASTLSLNLLTTASSGEDYTVMWIWVELQNKMANDGFETL
jgi:hypothetical protein